MNITEISHPWYRLVIFGRVSQYLSCVLNLLFLLIPAIGSDIPPTPFSIHEATEASLRNSIIRERGAIPVHKLRLKSRDFIYLYPRIRGGGRGVRDILVYSGNDQHGWNIVLWQRTFFVEIKLSIDHDMLTFKNENGDILVSMSPIVVPNTDKNIEADPRDQDDPFAEAELKGKREIDTDIPKK